MKKQIFLAVVVSVMCLVGVQAQSWWRGYADDSTYILNEMLPMKDGNFKMLTQRYDHNGAGRYSHLIIKKINPSNGNILKRDTVPFPYASALSKSFPMENGGFVSLLSSYDTLYSTIDQAFIVARFDSLNRIVRIDSIQSLRWLNCGSFVKRNDSTFATVAKKRGTAYTYEAIDLIIFNPLTLTVSSKVRIDTGYIIGIETLINSYVIFYNRRDTFFRVETNRQGVVLNRKTYSNLPQPNTNGYLFHSNNIHKDGQDNIVIMTGNMIAKFNANGDLVWSRKTAFIKQSNETRNADIKILPDGKCVFAQWLIDGVGNQNGLALYKMNERGDSIWWKSLGGRSSFFYPSTFQLNTTNDGGFLLSGYGGFSWAGQVIGGIQLIRLDASGDINITWNVIKGQIKKDNNQNCRVEATDTPLARFMVEARNTGGGLFHTLSDSVGNYSLLCDTGIYTIKTLLTNALWQNCTPSVSRQISMVGTTDTVDLPIKALINCPVLTVDLSTSGFRRCFETSVSVKYCNNGTIPAANAYVDIRLDSLIEFTSATRLLASQNRNVFRFNLGTIGIGECGNFTIKGRVRCGDSTRLGQTLCNEAHIYPDSVCLPIGTFSGANLTVSGSCVGDSVQFIVKNVGTATSQNVRSVVIEDEVLFMRNNINGLLPNATFSRKYKANGSTWRMMLEQEPNHPTSQFPMAFVEGCGRNGNGGVSTGFGTTFGNDDATPSVSTLCRPIVGSYDPNDKQGFPTGYKAEHFIRQNQDLDYVIRFQNTGTDTAFLVVIRDTLSDVLDIASIEFGGSSHAYEADIYGKNIVKFTFKNINLPDSFRNVAASQGFVKFRIKQKKDLAIGTKINNKAGIYFDFNDPIITNTMLHTVAKDLVITAIIEPTKSPNSLTINVLPNPFTEHATFELLAFNTPFNVELSSPKFELYDALGRLLRSEKITNYRFDFHRKNLSNGLYFFKITDKGKVLGNGKLMIQ